MKNIAVVYTKWNENITKKLAEDAIKHLEKQGVKTSLHVVAGAVELPWAAQNLVENKKADAVICMGCIIKGETDHYDFVARSVTYGIQKASLLTKRPIIFGVLTVNKIEQALARLDGTHSFCGIEFADAALMSLKLESDAKS